MYKLLLCFMILIPVANAQLISNLQCSANGTVLYYINGVGTLEKDGSRSLIKIRNKILVGNANVFDKKKNLMSVFIHNSTRGKANDIAELYNQALRNLTGQQKKEFYREQLKEKLDIVKDEKNGAGDPRLEKYAKEALEYIYSKKNEENPSSADQLSRLELFKVTEELDGMIATLLLNITADFEVVNKIKNELISSHAKHKKIIAVAHSAGNEALRSAVYELRGDNVLFADLNKLADFDDIFGVLHVASPSPTLAVRTDHARAIKLDRDIIIKNASLILPQNPIAPTYKYESSNLSGYSEWKLLGPLVEEAAALIGGAGYHGFDEIYLSDNVRASEIGSSGGVSTMRNIFTKNLIEVAESLGDNCLIPIVKISSPEVAEINDKMSIAGYAGENRIVNLKIEDIAGDSDNNGLDDVPGYNRKETIFDYLIETIRPATSSITYTDWTDGGTLLRDVDGNATLELKIPYRDYKYKVTITATNSFGNTKILVKEFVISGNKPPTANIADQVCFADSHEFNPEGKMFYKLTYSDDSYTLDGKVIHSEATATNKTYTLYDGTNSSIINISNQCPVLKIRYRWEVRAQCQGIGCDPAVNPGCNYYVNSGAQGNDLYVFYATDNQPAFHRGGADGVYGHSITGSFIDPNDPTQVTRILYPTGEFCERGKYNDGIGTQTVILSN